MRSIHKMTLAAATVALVASAFAASPVAAAGKPHVVFVNGRPGAALDVCRVKHGRRQVLKGKLRYGAFSIRRVPGGKARIQFRRARRVACSGPLVASRFVAFPWNSDQTIVATRFAPGKITIFDNAAAGIRPAALAENSRILRSAADFGFTIRQRGGADADLTIGPAADPVWDKGDENILNACFISNYINAYWVTLPDDPAIIAGPVAWGARDDTAVRIQMIVTGSNANNARLVKIEQPISWETPSC